MAIRDDFDEEQVECVACGATFAPQEARAFPIHEMAYLCWSCSLDRGGRFDASQDRWVLPPDVHDLHVHP